jgi:hypothetical protein
VVRLRWPGIFAPRVADLAYPQAAAWLVRWPILRNLIAPMLEAIHRHRSEIGESAEKRERAGKEAIR